MTFKKFIKLYDDNNAYINIKDDRIEPFINGKCSEICKNVFVMSLIADKQVIAFDIEDSLLTITLDMEREDNDV